MTARLRRTLSEVWPQLTAAWVGLALIAAGYLILGRDFLAGVLFILGWLRLSEWWFKHLET